MRFEVASRETMWTHELRRVVGPPARSIQQLSWVSGTDRENRRLQSRWVWKLSRSFLLGLQSWHNGNQISTLQQGPGHSCDNWNDELARSIPEFKDLLLEPTRKEPAWVSHSAIFCFPTTANTVLRRLSYVGLKQNHQTGAGLRERLRILGWLVTWQILSDLNLRSWSRKCSNCATCNPDTSTICLLLACLQYLENYLHKVHRTPPILIFVRTELQMILN